MEIQEAIFERGEKIIFSLRGLYHSRGYRAYRMSKFEEYDLYAKNKEFLVSDNVITFNDAGGKLMALRPDVTLSIIKNSKDVKGEKQKVYYHENVYRVSGSSDSFREIMQTGIECFGDIDDNDVCEVLELANESLKLLADDAVLSVSDITLIAAITGKLGLKGETEKKLYKALSERNFFEVETILSDAEDKEAAALFMNIVQLHGLKKDILPKLDKLIGQCDEYARFKFVMEKLPDSVQIDFSITGDMNYYNGIIFKGFIRGIPSAVLSGGQYDSLMRKMGRKACAVGFAVYTDELDHMDSDDTSSSSSDDEYINIALPKGRLGDKVYDMFARAGYECPSILEPNRKLIFENAEKKVRYFWVKPSDVAIYVERGAADIGVAGKDILLEYAPDVYELLDLKKGKCRMAVAAPEGSKSPANGTLRVATKFANIAGKFYSKKGRDIDIIHLNGSIEIAPILGLSDVIVDIVETGNTLRENHLEVIEEIVPITARLIANKAAFKFKSSQIEKLAEELSKIVEV